MDSSVSGKDEIWFLRVYHHVPHELYVFLYRQVRLVHCSFFFGVAKLSVRPHGTARLLPDGFLLNLIPEVFFRKSVEKIEVLIKPDKNNGYFR